MGKKGSWFSAIKRVLVPNSKEKIANGPEKRTVKEKKKWGLGKLRHGDGNSFIPLYREPSSIEKILGDVEREQQKVHQMSSDQQQKFQPSIPSIHPISADPQQKVHVSIPSLPPIAVDQQQKAQTSTPFSQSKSTDQQQKVPPSTATMPSRVVNQHKEIQYNATHPPKNINTSAIKIQTAYRGYMARRSYRALKGLVRLQGVMRGQSVRRQTINAMRCMQLLVRVQTQIQSRRIQMLEIQALERQTLHRSEKDVESSLGRWTLTSETGQQDWDDSLLPKEEIDARFRRKVEAVMKRERAQAYAYSHQLWKAPLKSAHTALMDIRSGGLPWWWNWMERQLPGYQISESQTIPAKNGLTPSKPISEHSPLPQSSNYRQGRFGFENLEALTPRSSKSSMPTRTKLRATLSSQAPQTSSSTPVKHLKRRTSASEVYTLRDDESLTSCPPFSMPNYMAPTISAKAKVRTLSNLKEGSPTPSQEAKRRLSFPLTQSIGSLRWNKGSLFSSKDSMSQRISGKHKSTPSIGNLSVDSTISLPVGVGRKPFK
ncbi:PREDICTED: protein IQ-DOMAIN 14-like [Nelumbo nucifera]|uniref:Protein IQ-DOMAIN 14-like n=1 Tax=Nelumbo nucifera TaxID=4432 RepID=A0A1U7YXE4_NELNU|nr:PREDICTED: protein IQ-DOMAIN 14-like [Nelumbo nucifera]XP_010242711.1 PREDICTED: protein IQ-DOMAIN 14-like [Nelumbo nucifera]